MALVPEAPRDQQAHVLTAQLVNGLRRGGVLKAPPDSRAWAKEFNTLTAQVPEARVRRVLDWYAANAGGAYTPQAYSAKSFRLKFEQIEAAMLRRESPQGLLTTPLPPDVQRAAALLAEEYEWPANVAPHLGRLISSGRAATASLLAVLELQRAHPETTYRDGCFITRVRERHLYREFVQDQWLPWHRENRMRGGRWPGPAQALAFDPASETFRDFFWWDWAQGWCLQPTAFDALLARVLQDSKHSGAA